MVFVIFVMLWTNSIIGEIKRYTVCGAIGLWYYGELPRSQVRALHASTFVVDNYHYYYSFDYYTLHT